ncbi:hypothetical protein Droror1_Dr00003556 [Drosera rotundifolia]
MASSDLPVDFHCPISLEPMTDPVILSTGHTFDRASIQRWLDTGHRTCPITKLPLPDPPLLIPNLALRSLINSDPHSPAHLDHRSLISSLSASTCPSIKLETLTRLDRFLRGHPGGYRGDSALVSAVLCCAHSTDKGLRRKALAVLLSLSLDDDNKVGLVAEGGMGTILGALTGGDRASSAMAATVVTSLAMVEVNKATIGEYPGMIVGLVGAMGEGKGVRVRKEAATALCTLCGFAGNRRRAVEEGAVEAAVGAAREGVERGVEVLGALGKCREGRDRVLRCEGVVEILVWVLRNNGSKRGVRCALLLLLWMCSCSERRWSEARNQGVVEICVGLVDDEDEKITRSASSLIQVLQRD